MTNPYPDTTEALHCIEPGCKLPRYQPNPNSQVFRRCEQHQKAAWRKGQQKRRREICIEPGCTQPVHTTDSRRFSKCYQHASEDWQQDAARQKARREQGLKPRPYHRSVEAPPVRRAPQPADAPPASWRWWEQPVNHAERQAALVRHLGGKAELIP